MTIPQTWSLHGHNTAAQYFIGATLSEVFQEASCWCALQEIGEVMGIQYGTHEGDNDEMVHSLTIFYDTNK